MECFDCRYSLLAPSASTLTRGASSASGLPSGQSGSAAVVRRISSSPSVSNPQRSGSPRIALSSGEPVACTRSTYGRGWWCWSRPPCFASFASIGSFLVKICQMTSRGWSVKLRGSFFVRLRKKTQGSRWTYFGGRVCQTEVQLIMHEPAGPCCVTALGILCGWFAERSYGADERPSVGASYSCSTCEFRMVPYSSPVGVWEPAIAILK